MKRPAVICALTVLSFAALGGPLLAARTSEGTRTGASYYNARAGNSWSEAEQADDHGRTRHWPGLVSALKRGRSTGEPDPT